MKTIILLLLMTINALALPESEVDRMANTIWRIEGGSKAKVPYGILSVKVKDYAEARKVCKNTIRNNWKRWEQSGRPGYYGDFLADRYCPPSVDPKGNVNWKRNFKAIAGDINE